VDGAGERIVGGGHHWAFADHQEALEDEGARHCRPGAGQNAGEGGAGDAHPRGGGLLVEPFEISEAQRLEFVESEGLDFEFVRRSADGLEGPSLGPASDLSELLGSCHIAS
jgi:hypothetical protein